MRASNPAGLYPNKEFAAHDELFREACRLAGIAATSRQASKWRNAKGLAYTFKTAAMVSIQKRMAGVS